MSRETEHERGLRLNLRGGWRVVRAFWAWKVRGDLQAMAEHLARAYPLLYPYRYGRIRPSGTDISIPWRGVALGGPDE